MRHTKAELETRIRALEHHVQHHGAVAQAQEKRADLAEAQVRAMFGTLEAERATLLARVQQIDVLLLLGGRTHGRHSSPEY